MIEAYLFLNEGFEEIEAIAPADILRRGGVELATVSLTGSETVTGSHNISVKADMIFNGGELNSGEFKPGEALFNAAGFKCGTGMLILPGGPGTSGYHKNPAFLELLKSHHKADGKIAAICAAPSVLGKLGLLNGKTACCYPGYEAELEGAKVSYNNVETDGGITTSRSAATAFLFGLELLLLLKGKEIAEKVKESMPILP